MCTGCVLKLMLLDSLGFLWGESEYREVGILLQHIELSGASSVTDKSNVRRPKMYAVDGWLDSSLFNSSLSSRTPLLTDWSGTSWHTSYPIFPLTVCLSTCLHKWKKVLCICLPTLTGASPNKIDFACVI